MDTPPTAWRLGFELDRRPVAVRVLFHSHRRRPIEPSVDEPFCFSYVETYDAQVAAARVAARWRTTNPTKGCAFGPDASARSTSSRVLSCAPPRSPRSFSTGGAGRRSVWNSAIATCAGAAKFTREPSAFTTASASAARSTRWISSRKRVTTRRAYATSKPIPVCSIAPSRAATRHSRRVVRANRARGSGSGFAHGSASPCVARLNLCVSAAADAKSRRNAPNALSYA